VVGKRQDRCLKEIVEKYLISKNLSGRPGGMRRQDSVKNGIDAFSNDAEIVVS
jgi:2-C-methyl-D-erythritol 4-phosphate cytidylyltransferase